MRERDAALVTRIETKISPLPSDGGIYEALIAVNDDVGDGFPIDLRAMDLTAYARNPVVLLAHDRFSGLPIGRTTELAWTNEGLRAKFEFLPGDPLAERVENAWKRGYLRSASIGAKRMPDSGGRDQLVEWSIVPVPADGDAVRVAQVEIMRDMLDASFVPTTSEEGGMDENKIREIVEAALKGRSGAPDAVSGDIAKALVPSIAESVRAALADETKRREEAETATAAAEKAFEERVAAEVEERMKDKMGDKKKAEGDDDMSDEDREKMSKKKALADAEERADLLVMVRELLPKDFDRTGKTNHEILVAAAGDEVKDAANRSEDYLRAKVESIVERRAAADRPGTPNPNPNPNPNPRAAGHVTGYGRVNLGRLKRS